MFAHYILISFILVIVLKPQYLIPNKLDINKYSNKDFLNANVI